MFKILQYISLGALLIFCVLLLFFIVNIVSFNKFYQEARSGKENIEQMSYFIGSNDFVHAYKYSVKAESNFNKTFQISRKFNNNIVLSNLPYFKEYINDVYYLTSALKLLSESAVLGTNIGVDLQKSISSNQVFDNLSRDKKKQILNIILNSSNNLRDIQEKIEAANKDLSQVKMYGLLKIINGKYNELKQAVGEANVIISKIVPASNVLLKILGHQEKSDFLMILQNVDELRPTGGFIGTYGLLQTEDSDINRLEVHDIYHLDMPVKDKLNISPPQPLQDYLGVSKWFMRDANWSPDWPTSARKIENFFIKEDQLLINKNDINNFEGEFDGVIAVNPSLVIDLLKFIGPVTIEDVEYNADNFIKLLEYRVEKGYVQLGIPSWQRKEVIGDIVLEIKKRIFDLKFSDMYNVFKIIDDNLNKKNILIYFHNNELEKTVIAQGWGGDLIKYDNDYLMVVDASMASLKTDAVVTRKLEYYIKQDVGGIFSELKINYANNGSFDWRTSRYRTFTRIYVPLGSEVIKIDGFEKESVKIYTDLGKTVFSGFLSVEPGEVKEVYVQYKLPEFVFNHLNKKGQYEMYLQKQPGSIYSIINIDTSFNNNIKSYSPTGFFVKKYNENHVAWEDDFNVDKTFKVKIK